jgi:hypothetical protein
MGKPCPAHFFLPTCMIPAKIRPTSGLLTGLIHRYSAIQPANDAYQFPLGFYLAADYARSLRHMFVFHINAGSRLGPWPGA